MREEVDTERSTDVQATSRQRSRCHVVFLGPRKEDLDLLLSGSSKRPQWNQHRFPSARRTFRDPCQSSHFNSEKVLINEQKRESTIMVKNKGMNVLVKDTPVKRALPVRHPGLLKKIEASASGDGERVESTRGVRMRPFKTPATLRSQEFDRTTSPTGQHKEIDDDSGGRIETIWVEEGRDDQPPPYRREDSWSENEILPQRPEDSIDPGGISWFEDDPGRMNEDDERNSYDDEMCHDQKQNLLQETDSSPGEGPLSASAIPKGRQWQTDRARTVGIKANPLLRSHPVIGRDMACYLSKKKPPRQSTMDRSISNPEAKRPLLNPLQKAMQMPDSLPTGESIPPPPVHLFQLSRLVPLSKLLQEPQKYLSEHQGGLQPGSAVRFNILALVIRVGPLEEVRDWKREAMVPGARDREGFRSSFPNGMMDQAEILVRDKAGQALKVDLHAQCASEWASSSRLPSQSPSLSLEASQTDMIQENDSRSWQTRGVLSNYNLNDSQEEPSQVGVTDMMTTVLGEDTTVLEKKRINRMLPLRPGDVIALSNLVLVRPRLSAGGENAKIPALGRGPTATRKRSAHMEHHSTSAEVHAVATPRERATMELCWRNETSKGMVDEQRNFEEALVDFDPRCKAIWDLAQLW